ncbi:MAG: hypothetical protein ACREMB_01075 [Candidatus Rokuibacteriota bacterium]
MDAARWLVYRYFGLPVQQRLAVARALGLVEPGDGSAPDLERFHRVFRRAREKRLLGRLWSEVEVLHPDGDTAENPFAGT